MRRSGAALTGAVADAVCFAVLGGFGGSAPRRLLLVSGQQSFDLRRDLPLIHR